jgi:hypothetical protein
MILANSRAGSQNLDRLDDPARSGMHAIDYPVSRRGGGIESVFAPKDRLPQFPTYRLSSYSIPMSWKPCPVQIEACPMPANNGLRQDLEH